MYLTEDKIRQIIRKRILLEQESAVKLPSKGEFVKKMIEEFGLGKLSNVNGWSYEPLKAMTQKEGGILDMTGIYFYVRDTLKLGENSIILVPESELESQAKNAEAAMDAWTGTKNKELKVALSTAGKNKSLYDMIRFTRKFDIKKDEDLWEWLDSDIDDLMPNVISKDAWTEFVNAFFTGNKDTKPEGTIKDYNFYTIKAGVTLPNGNVVKENTPVKLSELLDGYYYGEKYTDISSGATGDDSQEKSKKGSSDEKETKKGGSGEEGAKDSGDSKSNDSTGSEDKKRMVNTSFAQSAGTDLETKKIASNYADSIEKTIISGYKGKIHPRTTNLDIEFVVDDQGVIRDIKRSPGQSRKDFANFEGSLQRLKQQFTGRNINDILSENIDKRKKLYFNLINSLTESEVKKNSFLLEALKHSIEKETLLEKRKDYKEKRQKKAERLVNKTKRKGLKNAPSVNDAESFKNAMYFLKWPQKSINNLLTNRSLESIIGKSGNELDVSFQDDLENYVEKVISSNENINDIQKLPLSMVADVGNKKEVVDWMLIDNSSEKWQDLSDFIFANMPERVSKKEAIENRKNHGESEGSIRDAKQKEKDDNLKNDKKLSNSNESKKIIKRIKLNLVKKGYYEESFGTLKQIKEISSLNNKGLKIGGKNIEEIEDIFDKNKYNFVNNRVKFNGLENGYANDLLFDWIDINLENWVIELLPSEMYELNEQSDDPFNTARKYVNNTQKKFGPNALKRSQKASQSKMSKTSSSSTNSNSTKTASANSSSNPFERFGLEPGQNQSKSKANQNQNLTGPASLYKSLQSSNTSSTSSPAAPEKENDSVIGKKFDISIDAIMKSLKDEFGDAFDLNSSTKTNSGDQSQEQELSADSKSAKTKAGSEGVAADAKQSIDLTPFAKKGIRKGRGKKSYSIPVQISVGAFKKN